ncbi:S53 family peptidase [Actinocrispum sp. NPDC049592]|uniref:S53 family peptidase n=1 Tax=Actinocrispum sp. NPDC049592 TaxID=3154835 RepID=UPI003432CA28
MNSRILAAVAGVVAALAIAPAAQAAPSPGRAACPEPGPGFARCLTHYGTTTGFKAAVDGWGATDLASAYKLPATGGTDTLVAISIAFDAPTLENDLNEYRRTFGIPECTTANGCFRKVNQNGDAAPLPQPNFGWAVESTLDVSMVSAACPTCKILVVEGNTNSFADLAATEDTAIRLGAKVVSNSYGAREMGQNLAFAKSYDRKDVTVVASSGDSGFTAGSFPAVFSSVVAVGGTVLERDDSTPRGWIESTWQFGGSGCSAYIAKPAWQKDKSCSKRTTSDVSAAADNIAIYVSDNGWFTVSGTSASAPFIAGLFGRNGGTAGKGALYKHAADLFDVTSGTNDFLGGGTKCGQDYLCVAQPGYDAPTGVGTPNGLGAFK